MTSGGTGWAAGRADGTLLQPTIASIARSILGWFMALHAANALCFSGGRAHQDRAAARFLVKCGARPRLRKPTAASDRSLQALVRRQTGAV